MMELVKRIVEIEEKVGIRVILGLELTGERKPAEWTESESGNTWKKWMVFASVSADVRAYVFYCWCMNME